MNPEQLDKLETVLCEAADKLIAEGGKIVPDVFADQVNKGAYCPIGAATREVRFFEDRLNKMTELLGFELSEKQLWEFVRGFDNEAQGRTTLPNSNFPLEMLGAKLAKRYVKGERQ
jgi:hypothetical protein